LNRARKRGITVDMGGKPEFEAILDLMESRYAQQGKILTASRFPSLTASISGVFPHGSN